MKYILDSLRIMEKLKFELSFEYVPIEADAGYRGLIQKLNFIAKNHIVILNKNRREEIIDFLKSLEIEKEQELLCEKAGVEYSEDLTFSDLTDSTLLDYLVTVLRTISWVEKDNLLLVKYSKTIWNTGWHNLAKQCRGKVFDLNTWEIVSYPFNKFYNLGEVEETSEERITDLLNKANAVYVTDKKDGSAIIVTNYEGRIVINTNGEFDNEQVKWAKKLFEDKYSYFYNNIPEGYTFVFELIHPENQIVLDYGDEKSLYLLGVRDLSTMVLKSYPELVDMAEKYHLDITESFEYTNLYDFIEKTQTETENIKEGWVFRVITDTEDVMFKLKYQEYFKLHRLKSIPSLKKVYVLLQSGTLDDVLSVVESDIKDSVMKDVSLIFDYIQEFKDIVAEEVIELKEKYKIEGELEKSVLIKIAQEMKVHPFGTYILRAIKGQDIDSLFEILPKTSSFERLYKFTNERLGITEDIWDSKE